MRVALRGAIASIATCGVAACSLFVDTGDLVGDRAGRADAKADSFGPAEPLDAADAPDVASLDDGATLDDALVETGTPDVVVTPDAAIAYRDAVLLDAPIAYWRFGETSGTVAHDETSHGNDATLGSGITWGAAGALVGDSSSAIRLDGTEGLDAGQKFDFAGTAAYSLEAWINPSLVDDTYRHIFSKNDQTQPTGREEYGLFVQSSEGLTFERWVEGATAKVAAPVPTLNKWIHVVSTYDGGKMTLYVNGLPVAARVDTRSQLSKPVDVFVGCKTTPTGVIHGILDEIAVYDHALTSARIAAHMAASGR